MRAFAERLDAGLAALTEEHARFERALELIGSSTVISVTGGAREKRVLRSIPLVEILRRLVEVTA